MNGNAGLGGKFARRMRRDGGTRSPLAAGPRARPALAVEDEFVPAEPEPGRRERRQSFGTARDVEDLAAVLAAEMVMVVLGRSAALVAGRLSGQLDRNRVPVLDQALQDPVDRRYPQAGGMAIGQGKHLGRAERPPYLVEHAADRLILLRVPAHHDALDLGILRALA
jgi:hypothetical protein